MRQVSGPIASCISGSFSGSFREEAAQVKAAPDYQERIAEILQPLVSSNLLSSEDMRWLAQHGPRQVLFTDLFAAKGDATTMTPQRQKHCEYLDEVASLASSGALSKEELRVALFAPESAQQETLGHIRNLLSLKMALYSNQTYDVQHGSEVSLVSGRGLTSDCLRMLTPEMAKTMELLIARSRDQ